MSHARYAHTSSPASPRSCPSMPPSEASGVGLSQGLIMHEHLLTPCVSASSIRSIRLFAFIHARTCLPACVCTYMQAGACMYVAACACACHHEETEMSWHSIMCLYTVGSMTHAYDSILSACACAAMFTSACLRLRRRRGTLSRSRR